MSNIMVIGVKSIVIMLRNPFSAKTVLERINKMPNVVAVEQVFPDDVILNKAKICVIKVKSSAIREVLDKLLADQDLEAAYEAPNRRPFN